MGLANEINGLRVSDVFVFVSGLRNVKTDSAHTAFLRILEYYRGILILTTNRAVNFDDAFYSRIHLTLTFKPLDQTSREDIWKNFLRGSDISSSAIAEFASERLNGRQIKNVVKMARLLAEDSDGAAIDARHIKDVLSVAREDFEIR